MDGCLHIGFKECQQPLTISFLLFFFSLSISIDYFWLRALLYIFKTEATCMFLAGSLVIESAVACWQTKIGLWQLRSRSKGNACMQAIVRNKLYDGNNAIIENYTLKNDSIKYNCLDNCVGSIR
jgi:hypothetical protein